ncbi:MAG: hypothetical protein RLY13_142 [Actinomycetota bacterium]|jgi:hypothetical protein
MAPRFVLGQKWIQFPPAITDSVLSKAQRWPGKALKLTFLHVLGTRLTVAV